MPQVHEVSRCAENSFPTARLLLERENILDVALVARKGIKVDATRCLACRALDSLRFHDEVSIDTVDGGRKALLRFLLRALALDDLCTVLVGNFTRSEGLA